MAEDVATRNEPRAGAERWSNRTRRFLFGDDVFISYSRRDAADYALALASELTRRELSCFLDQWGTPPGSQLPEPLKAALRGSGMLVLIGTRGAAESENVREEVEEFLKTGRTIIPITFSNRGTGTAQDAKVSLHGTLEQSTWYDLIRGTSVTVESLEALAAVTPSALVIDRIANARGFTRRNKRLRQVFWGTLASVGVLLIAFAIGTEILRGQAASARKAADDAEDKRKNAVIAQGKAEEAEKAAGLKQKAAEILERRSTAKRLSASSKASTDDHPTLALALAVEAVNAYRDAGDPPVANAEEALRQALARIGGTPLPGLLGGDGVASSRDGLRLFTSAQDATVQAWDLSRGRPTPTMTLKGGGSALNLSDDGRWLVAIGPAEATLWDLARADPSARPFVLRGRGGIAWARFTPDGRRLLSRDGTRTTAHLWDLRAEDPAAHPSVLSGMTPAVPAAPNAASGREAFFACSDDGRWVVASRPQEKPILFDTTKDDPLASPVPLPVLTGRIERVLATADGRRIAVGDLSKDGSESGKTVGVWTLGPGGVLDGPPLTFEHPEKVEAMALSPDGRWFVTGDADQLARLWDLSAAPDAAPKVLNGHSGQVSAVAFSPDSRWLATGSDFFEVASKDSSLIILWDLKPSDWPGRPGKTRQPADHPIPLDNTLGLVACYVRSLAFSPDNHWLTAQMMGTGGELKWEQQVAHLWRMNDDPSDSFDFILSYPRFKYVLRGHGGGLVSTFFTRNGHTLVTAGLDRKARVWDAEAGAWAAAPISLASDGDAPTILARGRWLAAVGQTVRLWDLGSPPPKADGLILTTHRGPNPVAAIDGRGRRLVVASASFDHKLHELRLFDLTQPRPADRPTPLEGHARPVDRIAIDDAGDRMVTFSYDGTLLAWDLTANPPTSTTPAGHGEVIALFACSRDGRRLATVANGSRQVRLHDLAAVRPAEKTPTLDGHADVVDQLVFSGDGRWLATRSHDGQARLWPLDRPGTGQAGLPIVLNEPGHAIGEVEISPDDRWMVTHESETADRPTSTPKAARLRLWDLAAADPSASPRSWPFAGLTDVRFAPDGRSVMTHLTIPEIKAIADSPLSETQHFRPIAIRDLTTQDPTTVPPRILDVAFGVHSTFSPDGRRLLCDNQLVDLSAGADPTPVTLPFLNNIANHGIRSAGFSPDGRWAILGVDDRVELHPLNLDELLGLARDAASRNLTREEGKRHLPDQPYRKTFPDLP